LPEPSTAEQVTLVVPNGKVDPELGAQLTTGAGSPLSVAAGRAYCTTVPEDDSGATTMTSLCGARTGRVVSTTVTVNDPVDRLPAASVAVQSTLAGGPRLKREPDEGEQLRPGEESTLSVAKKVTAVPSGDVA
jgi:hypothetical protein